MLLSLVLREVSIIRGDGPVGFSETMLKGIYGFLILIISLIGWISSVIFALRKMRNGTHNFLYIGAVVWLTFFAFISVMSACGDDGGYCQHWSIYLK